MYFTVVADSPSNLINALLDSTPAFTVHKNWPSDPLYREHPSNQPKMFL